MRRKTVLCGCGAMAKGWLRAVAEHEGLRDRIEIAGLVDLNLDTARALADEFGLSGAVIGSDLGQVIDETGAELVFDVVVPVARAAVVETALAHGCHVLSEKPMAASLDEAEAMLKRAKAAGRIHAVVQNRRYIPGIRRLKAFVESGAIGDLTGIHCDFFIGAHFGGFRDVMEHVLLLDMAIHTFDAARFVSGKAPLAVYAHETNPAGSWYRDDASAFAIFEMADNVTFTYRGSWCAEGANTSWESQWRITGAKGTLLWDGADSFIARRVAEDEGFLRAQEEITVPGAPDLSETHGHASVIAAFLTAVETGTPPETAGDDNIRSLAMVFAAIESAERRARVAISPL
ncbi:oxidoreductase [Rhizobium rhizosphaerae]|uniref:Oxidoreductase n=1 Tax=Xaviernesmea rhizosphaerae TaxID=1672749 RepID=A0ABX3PGE1_9HYPH|nr:Gfo/Idh/MocA family oxidoreductase [Xaviernesmea rhizosphaerae]OQP87240.1 oxidoreductase [Xaviernesmea rhizosphaerae]